MSAKNTLTKILVAACLLLGMFAVPVMAHGHGQDHGTEEMGAEEGDWLSTGPIVHYDGIYAPPGSTVIRYTSTGHTFHSATYNPWSGVTTITNPRTPVYLGTQLYSYPIETSDGTITLYGYNGYYPFGYNQATGEFYFYGTQSYYDYYTLYDPWYKSVAWPFLRGHGFTPGISTIHFVSNPAVTYTYSSSIHYGTPGEWLPFI